MIQELIDSHRYENECLHLIHKKYTVQNKDQHADYDYYDSNIKMTKLKKEKKSHTVA